MNQTELHPSIISLVSLSAMLACNHPKQGLCQLDKLREYGVTQAQIDIVIEIARHFRDDAARTFDARFDAAMLPADAAPAIETTGGGCCTPTTSGIACC